MSIDLEQIVSFYNQINSSNNSVAYDEGGLLARYHEDNIILGDNVPAIVVLEHRFETIEAFPVLKERIEVKQIDASPVAGVGQEELAVSYETTANINIVESKAGYQNTLGAYTIAEDGTITGVEVLTSNVKKNIGNTVQYDVAEGQEMGLFIIANGHSANKNFFESKGVYKNLDLSEGTFSFILTCPL